MKLSNLRDDLLTQSTEGLDKIKGIPAYDALKPKIRGIVGEILDVLVSRVGDLNIGVERDANLQYLLAGFTGVISVSLSELELTDEDQQRVKDETMRLLTEAFRQQMLDHIREHHPEKLAEAVANGGYSGIGKQDLN